jgi:cytoskeleton protein RodZ
MQTIGERLEEARKRKGISIREAAEATKIRSDYLQKFEANTFDLDLPALYIKGFVRSYARYLDLDAGRLMQDFGAAQAGEGKAPRRESREVYGRVDFTETPARAPAAKESEPEEAPARPQLDQAMLLKYGVLGGGALIAVLLIILVINLLSSRSGPEARGGASAGPATPSVQVEAAQTLTLTAVEPTRVKVVQDLDGKVLFNGALARGETRSFPKQGRLLITVEIGKNLRTEVNGRNYPVPIDGYGRYALD